MNNKGFAITALLYGLSIIILMTVVLMMSVMQNSRKNTHTLVKGVEEGLDNLGATSSDGGKINIPGDQGGYYRVEMCSGGTLYSGTVYLKGGETVEGSSSKVIINGRVVMDSSKSYINGSARSYANSSLERKDYPFINTQLITGSACSTGFHMNKVSVDIPFASVSGFDGKTSVSASGASKVSVVFYNVSENPDDRIKYAGGASASWSGGKKIAEVYVEYTNDNSTTNTISFSGGTTISAGGNHKIKGNFTISRFSPYGSTDATTIFPGNYAISKLKKTDAASAANQENDIHDYKYEADQKTVFSTSTYTPDSKPATTDKKLVFYGHESMARPVLTSNYSSSSKQKWRFEKAVKDDGTDYSENLYRISEIEEYKTFEVHKQDSSEDEIGPILVCGEYVWDDTQPAGSKFKSTDAYTGNQNQQWKIESAGAGTFRFVTNRSVTPVKKRYLNCEIVDGENRCYITTTLSEASVFQIFNVDL